MGVVLDDYGLVHDGPVKAFHDQVLQEIGLRELGLAGHGRLSNRTPRIRSATAKHGGRW
jgi:hypothetical protein